MKVEHLSLRNYTGREFKLTLFRQEENKLLKKPARPWQNDQHLAHWFSLRQEWFKRLFAK